MAEEEFLFEIEVDVNPIIHMAEEESIDNDFHLSTLDDEDEDDILQVPDAAEEFLLIEDDTNSLQFAEEESIDNDIHLSTLDDEDEDEDDIMQVPDALYAEEFLFTEDDTNSLQLQEAEPIDNDFLLSTLDDEDEDAIMSDALYAEEMQLQEALIASVTVTTLTINPDLSFPSPVLNFQVLPADLTIKMSVPEEEESSGESSMDFCNICMERKPSNEMFNISGCLHSFCSYCINKHVEAKIQEGTNLVVCPGLDCKNVLQLESCRAVISKEVVDLWEKALCEELISGNQKYYCPFKDCSAILVIEDEEEVVIRESECPYCHRLFCAQCNVAWHPGVECEEFQRLNEDERGREDIMVRKLAREEKWSRCPSCKFYVERTEGCPHITCRCKYQFCYGCEAEWSQTHGGCVKK